MIPTRPIRLFRKNSIALDDVMDGPLWGTVSLSNELLSVIDVPGPETYRTAKYVR